MVYCVKVPAIKTKRCLEVSMRRRSLCYVLHFNSFPFEYVDDLSRFTESPMYILELACNSYASGTFEGRRTFITLVSHID